MVQTKVDCREPANHIHIALINMVAKLPICWDKDLIPGRKNRGQSRKVKEDLYKFGAAWITFSDTLAEIIRGYQPESDQGLEVSAG